MFSLTDTASRCCNPFSFDIGNFISFRLFIICKKTRISIRVSIRYRSNFSFIKYDLQKNRPACEPCHVRSKAMCLLMLILNLLFLQLWDYANVLCFVVRYFVSILVLQWSEERAGCFALFVFLVSREISAVLPHDATNLSAVCDCGMSWSYSLTISWQIRSSLFVKCNNSHTNYSNLIELTICE